MIKKIPFMGFLDGIVTIGFIFLFAYLLFDYCEDKQNEELKTKIKNQKLRSIYTSYDELITKYKAYENWDEQILSNKKYRLNPITILEIEKLLLDTTIAFTGKLVAIRAVNENEYIMSLKYSFWWKMKVFPFDIIAELNVSKKLGDSIINNHSTDFVNFLAGIGTIVNLNKIEIKINFNDGETRKAIIITGNCINAIYLPDLLSMRKNEYLK